jgi:DNA-binding IscR family transcriptional regulator
VERWGGYSLARPPAAISAADIIGALEGPIAITECSEEGHDGCCSRQTNCEVSGHWPRINQAIFNALQGISLLEMSRPDPLTAGAVSSAAPNRDRQRRRSSDLSRHLVYRNLNDER